MKKKFLALLLLLVIFFPVSVTFAQTTGVNIVIPNPFKCTGGDCTIMGLILAIFNNIVLPIAAIAVTLWIVWSGFMFIKAQGNETELKKAKQNLLWSLIGGGILLGAAGIASVVKNTIASLTNFQ